MIIDTIYKEISKDYHPHSAWDKGVKNYATMLMDEFLEKSVSSEEELKSILLNGAEDWKQYSYGGCALISDYDIAESLCPPYLFKLKKEGELPPSRNTSWLDVQARALRQAYNLIKRTFSTLAKLERNDENI